MASCDTKISLSESAKKRNPELRKVFEDLKNRKFCLEIVGMIAVGSGNEITVIAATLKSSPVILETSISKSEAVQPEP